MRRNKKTRQQRSRHPGSVQRLAARCELLGSTRLLAALRPALAGRSGLSGCVVRAWLKDPATAMNRCRALRLLALVCLCRADTAECSSSRQGVGTSCYVGTALLGGAVRARLERVEQSRVSASTLSLLSAAGDHRDLARRSARLSVDRKWFVQPPRLQNQQRSYFEETWGPIMEQERRKRALAGNGRLEMQTGLGAARPQEEGDDTNRRVQEMLEHVDSDLSVEDADGQAQDGKEDGAERGEALAPGTFTPDHRDYGEAPTAIATASSSGSSSPSAPARVPSPSRASKDAPPPRCGPRASFLRGRSA